MPRRLVLGALSEVSAVGELVQLRDFKRREEREAELARFAKQILEDTAPSDMPPVWPSFQAPESDPA